MSTRPQVRVPYPPRRHNSPPEPPRPAPTEPVADSYRHNIIRIHLPGNAIELIPGDVHLVGETGTAPTDAVPVHVVSGCNAFGDLAGQHDNAATTAALYEDLEQRGWEYHRAAVFPPGRGWVETAAAIHGVDLQPVLDLARHHGQEAVQTWDQDGLRATPTGAGPADVAELGPAPVSARPADLGCPMRLQDRATACVREGGPWVSASMEAALVWEHHRQMLVAALGCAVCAGGDVTTNGRPLGLTGLYTPSRRGGWQWGERLSAPQDPTQPDATDQEDEPTP